MSTFNFYTEEGLRKLKDELLELKTKGRSNIAAAIAEARDKGDLSENAEYDAAKDAQGLLELKISKLEEVVGNARVLNEASIDLSKVSIMTRVQLKNLKSGASLTYSIVSEEEADLKAQKISVKSPIGKGLLGKKVGEKAIITVPAGTVELEVVEIGALL
jgi:transcription elongation factor GreA